MTIFAPAGWLNPRPTDRSYLYKAEVRDVIDADTLLLDIDLGFEVIRRNPSASPASTPRPATPPKAPPVAASSANNSPSHAPSTPANTTSTAATSRTCSTCSTGEAASTQS